jgi:CIC family chloride channel protein
MVLPAAALESQTKMEVVMTEFERTGAWYLPVLSGGRFIGFVSRTRLFDTYRRYLKEASLD